MYLYSVLMLLVSSLCFHAARALIPTANRLLAIDIRFGALSAVMLSLHRGSLCFVYKSRIFTVCMYYVLELGQEVKDKKNNEPLLQFPVYKNCLAEPE